MSGLGDLLGNGMITSRLTSRPGPECPVAARLPRFPGGAVNGVPVVVAPAEIDITTADRLRVSLLKAASGEHPTVVVDMTRTRN